MGSAERFGSKFDRILFPARGEKEDSISGELVSTARKRLGIAALVIGFTFGVVPTVFALVYKHVYSPEMLSQFIPYSFRAITLLSILLYWAMRTHRFSSRAALRLGAVYEIVIVLLFSLLEARVILEMNATVGDVAWGVSASCLIILVFPLFLPMSPWKTFTVAALAATMGPLSYLLIVLPKTGRMDWGVFIQMYLPTFIAADLASIPAFVVKHLSGEVRRARELGSYSLVEKLGEGGMGEVWRAKHRMLARPAAVKLIQPRVLGTSEEGRQQILRRFEREAQATAALRSPNTIDLYDFGVAADGSFYYVMELLDGLDLDELVRHFGPQPANRVTSFLIQACHSLRNAHETELIHRDIKPGNLYVCRSGSDFDVIKVLDFGLVKSSGQRGSGETQLTRDGAITGTPAYMAPEMVLEEGEIDGRADLYSLACVAYWLLTGLPVFEADTAMKVMVMHAKEAPLPPSRRTELDVPAGLEQVLLSCLEKDPAQRPQSARELSRSLRALGIADSWTDARAESWWRTHQPHRVEALAPT